MGYEGFATVHAGLRICGTAAGITSVVVTEPRGWEMVGPIGSHLLLQELRRHHRRPPADVMIGEPAAFELLPWRAA